MADERLPLCALLSQVLVALTVEIDNTYESRAPHRTTMSGGSGPWLTSYGMWANFLRLVPADGTTVRDLAARAGYGKPPHPSQSGMTRWGYVRVAPDPADARVSPPRADWVVAPTRAGRTCAPIWESLPAEIEARWVERFGAAPVGSLRQRATDVVRSFGLELPAYLPQLDAQLFTSAPSSDRTAVGEPGLVTALANTLQAFAIEFEREQLVGLAATANVLRVLRDDGLRVRDLPRRAGIGTAAATWATAVLQRRGSVTVEPDSHAKRGKFLRLTTRGAGVRAGYEPRADAVESGWNARLGDVATSLRSALEEIVGLDDGERLRSGMAAPHGGWRAAVAQPAVLPHFPIVLHRGNYPDGS